VNNPQRYLIIGTLIALALILAVSTIDVGYWQEADRIGVTILSPTALDRAFGIWASNNVPYGALFGGLILPLLLISAATYFFLGRRR
jgi:hypothetical protein